MTDQQDSGEKKNEISETTFRVLMSIVLVVLTSLTIGFDSVWLLYPITYQVPTYWFESVPGSITESEVVVHKNDKSQLSYRIRVGYEYEAVARKFVGDRRRYGFENFGLAKSYPEQFVQSHPPGTSVEVFVSPTNPSDAVLVRGIEGLDLFCALFLIPFNVATFFGCYVALSALKDWWRARKLSLEVRRDIIENGVATQVAETRPNYLILWICVISLTSLVVTWITAMFIGFYVPMELAIFEWFIVLAVALGVVVWVLRVNQNSGQ